jgi:hypothetical protein
MVAMGLYGYRHAEDLQARLDRLDSALKTANARIALLQDELDGARSANAPQPAPPREQPPERKTGRKRIDFELGVNHGRELAPGIDLQVSATNVPKQRFDGSVSLLPEQRTINIRGQGALRPVVFSVAEDKRPRQLVVTRVTRYSVYGYLLVPE